MARILIVDDRPNNHAVLDRYLSEVGHDVDAVTGSDAALARVDSVRPYDLFLIDVAAPGLRAYELSQRIRSRDDSSDAPVLFLTDERGEVLDEFGDDESGANDFLQKPVNAAEMLSRVAVLLRLRQALAGVRDANTQLERLVAERTSELRDALASLERQRSLWESVVHGLPAAVLLHGDENELLQANEAAIDSFGKLDVGCNLSDTPVAEFFGEEARAQLAAGGKRVTRIVQTPNRGQRYFEAELTRLAHDDSSWLLHLQDVTERERAVEESKRRVVSSRETGDSEPALDTGQGYRMKQVLGHSRAMAKVHQAVNQLRNSRASVLISGESGTGKELVARAIHYDGALRDQPFVPVHCGAIPESLAESELFGYVKGAFTGAVATTKGLFEQADGGTIFLDEIGECSPDLQSKLLRVLQSGEIRPVGSSQVKIVDVRLIAATNRPLAELVREKAFREDLYYRLNVVQIDVPPLRERAEDIAALAQHLLEKHAPSRDGGRVLTGISRDAMRCLESYSWEGNVRELENVIVRAVALCRGPLIQVEDLSPRLQALADASPAERGSEGEAAAVARSLSAFPSTGQAVKLESLPTGGKGLSNIALQGSDLSAESRAAPSVDNVPAPDGNQFLLPRVMEDAERKAILRALKQVGGNKLMAAKLLGIGKSSLYRKIKELQIRD